MKSATSMIALAAGVALAAIPGLAVAQSAGNIVGSPNATETHTVTVSGLTRVETTSWSIDNGPVQRSVTTIDRATPTPFGTATRDTTRTSLENPAVTLSRSVTETFTPTLTGDIRTRTTTRVVDNPAQTMTRSFTTTWTTINGVTFISREPSFTRERNDRTSVRDTALGRSASASVACGR